MRNSRFVLPALVAFLSLGFMSQSPVEEKSIRRIAGTECVTCGERPAPAVSTQLPASLTQYLVGNGLTTSTDHYLAFSRQLELQSQLTVLNPILVAGAPVFYRPIGFPLPSFPSYSLPTLASTEVSLVKPDSSRQIFGGLSKDPALKYLLAPRQDGQVNTLSSAIEAVKPAPGAAAIVKKDIDGTLTVFDASEETVAPKKQDRLNQVGEIQSSPLVGSRPVKATIGPSITFSGVGK